MGIDLKWLQFLLGSTLHRTINSLASKNRGRIILQLHPDSMGGR